MLWMETFCFCCSVRLGVIVTAIISAVLTLTSVILQALYTPRLIRSIRRFLDVDDQPNQDQAIKNWLVRLEEQPADYTLTIYVCLVMHMVACALAVYGAMKLRKYFLVPYIVTKGVLTVSLLGQHIFFMVILKKVVNLGALIGITLAGGFYILYTGYCWAGAVALFQIIVLINSQKYKELYGEDPMDPRPITNILLGGDTIENVKIFTTPNNHEINALKRKNLIEEQLQMRYSKNLITVTPTEPFYKHEEELTNFNNWHWNELVGHKKGFN